MASYTWESRQNTLSARAYDGGPVSPGSIPKTGQMNAVEYAGYIRGGIDLHVLDPDMLSAFYPGILKAYGMWQVP